MSMNRIDCLETAKKIIMGDREQQYGKPENNFARIAHYWTGYLGHEITPKDVAAMMCLMKIARISSGHGKADNWVDLIGYAAIGSELESLETREE